MYDESRVQWTMTVTIFHGPAFGHAIELATETKGKPDYSIHESLGTWRGVGVPIQLVKDAQAAVSAVIAGHLMDRYGVAEQLTGWEVEPDPF